MLQVLTYRIIIDLGATCQPTGIWPGTLRSGLYGVHIYYICENCIYVDIFYLYIYVFPIIISKHSYLACKQIVGQLSLQTIRCFYFSKVKNADFSQPSKFVYICRVKVYIVIVNLILSCSVIPVRIVSACVASYEWIYPEVTL